MKTLERDIQKSIIDYLKLKGYLFIKNNTIGIYKPATGSYIPSQSIGSPDLFVFLKGGKTVCIEVKRRGGRMSEHQKRWKERADAIGLPFIVAYSLDEVLAAGL